eukprot:Amastigsp_a7353_13.p3 type:complete len:128 gc:universal Amastigsp_a7353_13:405-22(-)
MSPMMSASGMEAPRRCPPFATICVSAATSDAFVARRCSISRCMGSASASSRSTRSLRNSTVSATCARSSRISAVCVSNASFKSNSWRVSVTSPWAPCSASMLDLSAASQSIEISSNSSTIVSGSALQ